MTTFTPAVDPTNKAGITVANSLQPGAPVPFVPKDDGVVTWYSCGPTVYDLSHMGHARNYVSTDVIRRILMHYFGFKVHFVMNITDVDDKIIVKARRKRLFDLECAKPYTPAERRALVADAFAAYAQANLSLLLEDGKDLNETTYAARRDAAYGAVLAGKTLTGEGRPGDDEAKIKMHLANMDAAAQGLLAASAKETSRTDEADALLPAAEEILLPHLDALYKETIDTSDQTMFTDLTQGMEALFTADMNALNVLPPDDVTRVTEYVPQIVAFIEGIVRKGFAYEANASVYFDIEAFEGAGNTYARLRPESRNDKALQDEGEGTLSKSLAGKRRPGDFALWKKSKPGEPAWPSPWGAGRPGWHIECSVMASDKLGAQMDVHSGGIDLAFPHHDNELAQSEAYFHDAHPHDGCVSATQHTWVRYFFHMGHLSIAGSKMSKSLKNFQTIQDALGSTYTARSMRVVFMLSRWYDGLEISPDMRKQATSWETTLDNFFTNVKARLAEAAAGGGAASGGGVAVLAAGVQKLGLDEKSSGFAAEFAQAQRDLDAALRNSFDTPAALQVLLRLVRNANVYMSDAAADVALLEAVARWVTRIVGVFGLDPDATPPYGAGADAPSIGWGPANPTAAKGSSGGGGGAAAVADPETAVQPYRAAYAKVRAEVEALDVAKGTDAEGGDTAVFLRKQLKDLDPDAAFAELAGRGSVEQLAMPYLRAVSALRDAVRWHASAGAAGSKADEASKQQRQALLALSDRIRDYDLTELGVQLDDQPYRPSLIKFVPVARLVAAREEKAAAAAEKARQRAEAQRAREAAEAEKWEKAKVAPQVLFRGPESGSGFSAWDADGLPTKLADGSDVPKTQQKRLKKEWERQKKAHEAYLEKFGKA